MQPKLLSINPRRQQQALAADWDMVIVDEAHHLQWSEQAASPSTGLLNNWACFSQPYLIDRHP